MRSRGGKVSSSAGTKRAAAMRSTWRRCVLACGFPRRSRSSRAITVTGWTSTSRSSCDADPPSCASGSRRVVGPPKVRENVEAEAIDVILQEAVARLPFVFEVDTTNSTPQETAEAILAILQGKTKGRQPGSVDWASEVLSWY